MNNDITQTAPEWVLLDGSNVLDAVADVDWNDADVRRQNWVLLCNLPSMAVAESVAAQMTARMGGLYIASDDGACTSHRYGAKRVPQVGDKVSYSFNGDSRPDGEVASISKSLSVITTTTGNRYHRYRTSAAWRRSKTWWLISGHHNERNPHF